jgi:spectrin beta
LFLNPIPSRSWEKVYTVLNGTRLSFYKDRKSYQMAPGLTLKGEPALDVSGGSAEVAIDYTKKKNVFRLRSVSCGN